MSFGIQNTLGTATRILPEFQRRIKNAPYENKGVLFSEVLFVWASAQQPAPARVLESGRACGVSTYLLSVCFQSSRVISIEYDRTSPDVQVAARNLRDLPNVECRFGDAQQLLRGLVQENDIVVIDGPKQFRALRLAFRLLCQRRPAAVFIHDCFLGSCERTFLESNVKEAFYSDDGAFVERFGFLDAQCWQFRRGIKTDEFPEPYLSHGNRSSYGPTFACIPYHAGLNLRWIHARLLVAGCRYRLWRSLAKKRGVNQPSRRAGEGLREGLTELE